MNPTKMMSKCILETDYKDMVLKVSHLLAGRQKPPNKVGKGGASLVAQW